MGILSYILQYSELNYNFFKEYKGTISRTLGYFSETAPIAVTSLSFSSINIIKFSILFSYFIVF